MNPVTGNRVFDFQLIKQVLTVMFTCGLYDFAGAWAYEVGIPAKSGVSGGVFGVVNRQQHQRVFKAGRARQQCARHSGVQGTGEGHLGLHAFEFSNVGSSFMQWLL